MEQTVKDRLLYFLKTKRIRPAEFTRTFGVSRAYISSMRKAPSNEMLEKISLEYPELNMEWLITGDGTMIKANSGTYGVYHDVAEPLATYAANDDAVPFYDTEAASCGYLAGFGAALDANNPSAYILVPDMRTKDGDFFLRTRGRSMIDTLHPELSIPEGALVLVRKWDADYIQWGEIYCVATPEGYAIKRLMPSTDATKITLQSADQLNYPSYEIAKTNILAIGKVLGILTYKEI